MLTPFIHGLFTGAGLIIAIGAQNAFVLSQGVRKNHMIIIPVICALCDAVLIMLGVTGTGRFLGSNPTLMMGAAYGGAVFLFWYGLGSFRSVFKNGALSVEEKTETSLKKAVLATLAVTLLNPHVYLDTVILLGSISAQFETQGRYLFGAGAATASCAWFFTLGLGGKLLAPLFQRPLAWKFLDGFVGVTMWTIAYHLVSNRIIS